METTNEENDSGGDQNVQLEEIPTHRQKCLKVGRYFLLCKCLKGASTSNYFEFVHHFQVMVQNIMGIYYASKVDVELIDLISADSYVELQDLYSLHWWIFWISTAGQFLIVISVFTVMVNWLPHRFSIFLSLVSQLTQLKTLLLFTGMIVCFGFQTLLAF